MKFLYLFTERKETWDGDGKKEKFPCNDPTPSSWHSYEQWTKRPRGEKEKGLCEKGIVLLIGPNLGKFWVWIADSALH